jgi:hypothetical protein
MVFFNPSLSQYAQYEASNLSNIEFTSGAPAGQAGSTPMYAWLESGASTAATNTVAWVNLGSSTLGAAGSGSNTLTIYMNFMPNNAPVTSGYTGYAPQLWCASGCFQTSYAQYDDGGNVFNFYDNFAGTTLNSDWSVSTGTVNLAINNGLTYTSSNNGCAGWTAIQNTNQLSTNQIIDAYLQQSGGESGIGNANCNNGDSFGKTSDFTIFYNGINGGRSYGSSSFPTTYFILSGDNANPLTLLNNYVPLLQIAISPITSDITIFQYGSTLNIQWLRTRSYPPNGVMPSVSFGSVS